MDSLEGDEVDHDKETADNRKAQSIMDKQISHHTELDDSEDEDGSKDRQSFQACVFPYFRLFAHVLVQETVRRKAAPKSPQNDAQASNPAPVPVESASEAMVTTADTST